MKNEVLKLLKYKFNVASFKDGIYTVKDSYYWGVSKSGEQKVQKVKEIYPNAEIIDYGNHYHGFVGGVRPGSSQDSYYWVKFKLPNEVKNN